MALNKTDENTQLFSRSIQALDKIVKDEKAHPSYVYFPCLSLTHLGISYLNMRNQVLTKLEEYRPRWQDLQNGQDIDYNIKRIKSQKYKAR